MPFELANSLKNTCSWSFSSRGMNNLFCNKFYTSAILTIMIIILIMLIYPCKKGTPFWITFKLGFYILFFTLGIVFIHDSVMQNSFEKEIRGGETEAFINALGGDGNVAFAGDVVKVDPKVDNTRGGDGMTGDGACCYAGGNDSARGTSNEEIFSMFGV